MQYRYNRKNIKIKLSKKERKTLELLVKTDCAGCEYGGGPCDYCPCKNMYNCQQVIHGLFIDSMEEETEEEE